MRLIIIPLSRPAAEPWWSDGPEKLLLNPHEVFRVAHCYCCPTCGSVAIDSWVTPEEFAYCLEGLRRAWKLSSAVDWALKQIAGAGGLKMNGEPIEGADSDRCRLPGIRRVRH